MANEEYSEAEDLFSRTWFRTLDRFFMILSFRKVAAMGLPLASVEVLRESTEGVNDLMTNPENDKFFLDKEGAIKAGGGVDAMATQMANKQLANFESAKDAASLVFAHSILDAAALDYCRVTSVVSRSSWAALVQKKKLELQEIREATYDQILQEKVEEYLQALDRQSLLTKIDRLFAVCKPPEKFAPIRDYEFDRVRLTDFDNIRHEIVHGEVPNKPLPNGDADIWFLLSSANYLMAIVNEGFGLKVNPLAMIDPKV